MVDLVKDLKFDEMEVDCQLALNFLEENKTLSMYPCVIEDEYTRNYTKVISDYGINLFYTKESDFLKNVPKLTINNYCWRTHIKKLQLKMKENAELFSQLEWLIRKIPKEHVEEFDITLMVQNRPEPDYLVHEGPNDEEPNYMWVMNEQYDCNVIEFGDDTPLAVLGIVSQLLYWRSDKSIVISSSPNTAVICYLFTKLCHDVGLTQVTTAIFEQRILKGLLHIPDFDRGCTAVITGKADYNSAIDAILYSTVKYPWKIRRVLVQEDIIDSVWAVLRFKENLKDGDNFDETLQRLCKHIFLFGDKAVLMEFAGEPSSIGPHNRHLIFLETYRTTKELLMLLTSRSPLMLSIWSNDINDANVIAYGSPIDTTLIWVNDYGTFDGPRQVSEAVYSAIEARYSYNRHCSDDKGIISKLLPAWSELDIQDRFKIVNEIIKDLISEEESKRFYEACFIDENNICTLKNGKIYNMMHRKSIHVSIKDDMKDLVELVKGYGVILFHGNDIRKEFKAIADKGLPLVLRRRYPFSKLFYGKIIDLKTIPKVIIQNCGAVLAT